METYHIHIEGRVQGVGFRPFIYRLAHENSLRGWVNNGIDGVHIEINADDELAYQFLEKIKSQAPSLALITTTEIEKVTDKKFKNFKIVSSDHKGKAKLLLTPDLAICDDCLKELRDVNNRRYRYPFITCTNCGPRFSIINKLPYDRPRTTMEPFEMCRECKMEYEDPTNRRHYSQTNSCPNCAVKLKLYDGEGDFLNDDQEQIVEAAIAYLNEGKIIAAKGIGGYLLLCDATNPKVIQLLRERKKRPNKPFALMYPTLEMLQQDVEIEEDEKRLYLSPESPIVLLPLKDHQQSGVVSELVAPNLKMIGAMRPYTPFFEMILKNTDRPLVATSGNVSGSPILYQDDEALRHLGELSDYVITNDREIVVPQDDSVLRITPQSRSKIIIRRSRGLAPTYLPSKFEGLNDSVLSMGAMLKSTFSIQHESNTYVSQYLGNLESFDSQESYVKCQQHFFQLLDFHPEVIIIDKHPQYFSTMHGKKLASKLEIPLVQVQHHKAHFGAVLAESDLLDSSEEILGVIWDGTGLGDDGHIWGGEYFTFRDHEINHLESFDYFDHILGDKMAREPRISALSLTKGIPDHQGTTRTKFSKNEWQLYNKMLDRNPLKTSSAGRLFDAVASLLEVCDRSTYEGEAAMRLESLASWLVYNRFVHDSQFKNDTVNQVIKSLLERKMENYNPACLAAKFHYTLLGMLRRVAEKQRVNKLAFSGGVFQNALLVDLIKEQFANDYDLYFHQELSPNDECISFGQVACYYLEKKKNSVYKEELVEVF